ncbi:MAG: cupin domain-containing protein [Oscillospiraceae bacterium]|nr:cupin domain-containing protein [Oscillospiraceae bacterium]
MVEQVIKLTQGEDKVVERLLVDENIHYAHIILPGHQSVPEHVTDAKSAYMSVIRGTLSIALDDQGIHEYSAGTMIKIPIDTRMSIHNKHDETLELIVVKAPAPVLK